MNVRSVGHLGDAIKSDRDLLAEWLGEELVASVRGVAAARAAHAARGEFYLDILRNDLTPVQVAGDRD